MIKLTPHPTIGNFGGANGDRMLLVDPASIKTINECNQHTIVTVADTSFCVTESADDISTLCAYAFAKARTPGLKYVAMEFDEPTTVCIDLD